MTQIENVVVVGETVSMMLQIGSFKEIAEEMENQRTAIVWEDMILEINANKLVFNQIQKPLASLNVYQQEDKVHAKHSKNASRPVNTQ
jgi:hypothetical protein